MSSATLTPSIRQRFRRNLGNGEDAIVMAIFDRSETSSSSLNGDFLWFQLYIEVLLRMKDHSSSKQELVNLCRQQYEDDAEKQKIAEFVAFYTPSDAIKWYTRDSFVYRILNRALRQQDMNTLYAFRCIIIDIRDQLQLLHSAHVNKNSIIHFYSGQSMSRKELERLQANVGNFVSMNSFFSTTMDRGTASIFAEARTSFMGVLFDLRVDMTLDRTKPFADITSISYYQDEEEVLFMLGTVFRLCQCTFDVTTYVWTIECELCNDDDHQLRSSLDSLKEQIDDETNLYELGRILWKMNQWDASEECFKRLLDQEHSNPVIVPGCYLHLGNIAHNRGHYDEAIERQPSFIDNEAKNVTA